MSGSIWLLVLWGRLTWMQFDVYGVVCGAGGGGLADWRQAVVSGRYSLQLSTK